MEAEFLQRVPHDRGSRRFDASLFTSAVDPAPDIWTLIFRS